MLRLALNWALFAPVAFSAAPATAYVLTGNAWPEDRIPVEYWISRYAVGPTSISDADVVQALKNGIGHWSEPACTYAASEFKGRSNDSAWAVRDGRNNIVGLVNHTIFSDVSVVASTSLIDDGHGNLVDVDIVFDALNYKWSVAVAPPGEIPDNAFDLESIATHEYGHLWGSTENGEMDSVMGGYYHRGLGADDVEMICFLYHKRFDIGGACATDADCLTDLFCVDDDVSSYCTNACNAADECLPDYTCIPGGVCVQNEHFPEAEAPPDGGDIPDDGGAGGGCCGK